MVVGLVGSILAVGEDGGTKLVAHIRQINPLMRRDLEFLGIGGRALDSSYIPVVGSELD